MQVAVACAASDEGWSLLKLFGLVIVALAFSGCAATPSRTDRSILIFSHTTGYRHASIPAGVTALKQIANAQGLSVEASEDPAVFSREKLSRFSAVVLLNSTTDPKDPASEWLVEGRRNALQEFVTNGGGIVAIHAAADSHYHWPWYGELIGARFARHPEGTPAGELFIQGPEELVKGLPLKVKREDEWYYFEDYDPSSELLIAFDPASIGEKDINPNPISWLRRIGRGRIFYSGMGHTEESYSEAFFLQHLSSGMRWAASK